MVQSAKAGESATMLGFCIIRYTALPEYLRRAVFRFVGYPDNFYRIFAFHLAQRPQAGKQMFLFGTAGFGADQAYFSQIIRRLEGELPQNCTVIGWYMCPGRMGEGVRRRYEAMLQDPVSAGQAELLLKNFDAVRTRPDERDAQALLAAAGL